MEKPTRSPLARSFERHMRAENRSDRIVATYLHGLRQAEMFMDARGTTVEAATRADLEAFMADLLARRTASTAATYYKILKVLYGWLVDEEELDADPTAKMKPPIVPGRQVPVVPADGLKRLFAACAGTSFAARRDTALIMLLLDTRCPPGRDGRAQAHGCRSGPGRAARTGQGPPRGWNAERWRGLGWTRSVLTHIYSSDVTIRTARRDSAADVRTPQRGTT